MLKEILENLDISEYGIKYEGNLFDLKISDENQIPVFIIEGKKYLKFPSYSEIVNNYDVDENKLQEIYKKLMTKYGKEVEKIAKQFDKNLNNIINNIEKEFSNIID